MNLKEVKQRILSVKGTQKITSAMKLVSAAKLRRAQGAIENMRPYQQKLDGMLSAFLSTLSLSASPYTESRDAKHVVVIPVSSDSSLCGGFNSNVIRLAKEVVDEYTSQGASVTVMPVGRKMWDAMRKTAFPSDDKLMEYCASPKYTPIATVANKLMHEFIAGRVDRVELVYTHFHSASKQEPVRELFLPMNTGHAVSGIAAPSTDFIVEPGKAELVAALLPKVISLRLFTALLDSTAAEHAARMIAMQIATDNADDLIAELTLEYNKGRQQAITNELLDIVSGSAK